MYLSNTYAWCFAYRTKKTWLSGRGKPVLCFHLKARTSAGWLMNTWGTVSLDCLWLYCLVISAKCIPNVFWIIHTRLLLLFIPRTFPSPKQNKDNVWLGWPRCLLIWVAMLGSYIQALCLPRSKIRTLWLGWPLCVVIWVAMLGIHISRRWVLPEKRQTSV